MEKQQGSREQWLVIVLVVLTAVCLYQGYRLSTLSAELTSSDLPPALLAECLLNAERNLESNQVSDEALAPRLLLDTDETAAYVADFPVNEYDVVPIPGGFVTGQLYLDDNNDVIKGEIRAGRAWESHVVGMIIRYTAPGTTVLDVGAHIGTHTLVM